MVAPKHTKEAQHNVEFAEGGSTHMFGPQVAGPDVPGNTGKSPGKGPGAKFAEGGKSKMYGFHGSQPQASGRTGQR